MSSGTKSTSTNAVPGYITDYGQGILNQATTLANKAYPGYTGELVAPQNSDETTGESNEYNNAYNFTSGLGQANNAASSLTDYLNNNGVPSSSDIMSYANNGQSPSTDAISSLYGNTQQVNGSAAENATNTSANTQAANAYNALGGVTGAADNDYANSGAQTWNPSTASSYMSPYEQTALNNQLQTMQTNLAQQQNAINGEATQSNAFGDSRQAVASTLANQNADLQMGSVESQGMNDAYNAAQTAYNDDNQNRLSAYNSGLSAGNQSLSTLTNQQLSNAQLGLSGVQAASGIDSQNYQNQLQGLTSATSANQAQEGLNLNGVSAGNNSQATQTGDYTSLINSLLGNTTSGQSLYNTAGQTQYAAGQASQNEQQNVDNANYQQFLNEVNYPYEMLQLQEGALGSVPYTTTQTDTNRTSAMSNILGLTSATIGAVGSAL